MFRSTTIRKTLFLLLLSEMVLIWLGLRQGAEAPSQPTVLQQTIPDTKGNPVADQQTEKTEQRMKANS